MTDRLRVALLARAGQARDQLHKALEESGALIVAEGEPGELDPKERAMHAPMVPDPPAGEASSSFAGRPERSACPSCEPSASSSALGS